MKASAIIIDYIYLLRFTVIRKQHLVGCPECPDCGPWTKIGPLAKFGWPACSYENLRVTQILDEQINFTITFVYFNQCLTANRNIQIFQLNGET